MQKIMAILFVLSVSHAPLLAADSCLPQTASLPDDQFGYLAAAVEIQQKNATEFLDIPDLRQAIDCAANARETSQALYDLATLAHIQTLTFEGETLLHAGSIEAANMQLVKAGDLVALHFLPDRKRFAHSALTLWAVPMANLIKTRSPDRAVPAFSQILVWSHCATIFVRDPAEFKAHLRDLGSDPDFAISDETCQKPITLTAFR